MAIPSIKITTNMIDDFSSPVSNESNKNSYLYVNDSNKIEYYTIEDIIQDINDAGGQIMGGTVYTPVITPIENGYELSWTNDAGLPNPETVTIYSGTGINAKGTWSETETYTKNDYVIYEDDEAKYGYLALTDVTVGTPLTETTYWLEMYKILKTYIAATMIDWGE